jgi:hypothetical protein
VSAPTVAQHSKLFSEPAMSGRDSHLYIAAMSIRYRVALALRAITITVSARYASV